uniref:Nucleolar protein 10 n=1 Tax=Steinernema glaseri TaxID=37863 RepID=A0A1I7YBD4_9BILA
MVNVAISLNATIAMNCSSRLWTWCFLPPGMYLKFYLDDSGKRVYTLKGKAPNGKETQSAHPARFSPEDKYSQYRLIVKKRFGILRSQQSAPTY